MPELTDAQKFTLTTDLYATARKLQKLLAAAAAANITVPSGDLPIFHVVAARINAL